MPPTDWKERRMDDLWDVGAVDVSVPFRLIDVLVDIVDIVVDVHVDVDIVIVPCRRRRGCLRRLLPTLASANRKSRPKNSWKTKCPPFGTRGVRMGVRHRVHGGVESPNATWIEGGGPT